MKRRKQTIKTLRDLAWALNDAANTMVGDEPASQHPMAQSWYRLVKRAKTLAEKLEAENE